MNILRFALCLATVAGTAWPAPEPTTPAPSATAFATFSADQLDQLLAPIALYPDALIALILPAATAPADVVLAARYLQETNNNLSQVESRAWDDSVKSLTHYPAIVKWMDENLDWTKQVGEAFATQPADVMKSLQRLRARARAAGTLVDSPQQRVLAADEIIRVVPTQPDVIYVPYYNSSLAYLESPGFYRPPSLTYGMGFPVGSWLAYELDWRSQRVWVGNRHRPWHRPDWNHPIVPTPTPSDAIGKAHVRPWHPPSRPGRSFVGPVVHPRNDIALPDAVSVTPRPSLPGRRSKADGFATTPPPAQPDTAQPPGTGTGRRRNFSGQQTVPADAANLLTTPTTAPVTAVPSVAPPTRQRGSDRPRDSGSRTRSFPGAQTDLGTAMVGPPAPAPTVPLPHVTLGAQVTPWTSQAGAPAQISPSFPTAAAPDPAPPPPPAQAGGNERQSRRGGRAQLD